MRKSSAQFPVGSLWVVNFATVVNYKPGLGFSDETHIKFVVLHRHETFVVLEDEPREVETNSLNEPSIVVLTQGGKTVLVTFAWMQRNASDASIMTRIW